MANYQLVTPKSIIALSTTLMLRSAEFAHHNIEI